MKIRIWTLLSMAGLVVLDQAAKWMVIQKIAVNSRVNLIPGFFTLHHVKNTGVAFGLFGNHQISHVFAALSGIAVLVLFIMYVTTGAGERGKLWAFSFLIGGALGNLVDRVFLGSVTDFLDFQLSRYHWPAFNIADMAVCLGVGVFIVKILTEHEEPSSEESNPSYSSSNRDSHKSIDPESNVS